jgi:hypothetical protein
LQGVVDDVFANPPQGCSIADGMLKIVALPQTTGEWRPAGLFYALYVGMGGNGFERADNVP